MLILLPPSEGKTAPRRGKPLDLDRAVASRADRRPPAGARRPGRTCARATRTRAACWASASGRPSRPGRRNAGAAHGPDRAGRQGLQRRALRGARSTSPRCRRPHGAGPRGGWRSPRRLFGLVRPATGSRPTGCPVTSRCPGSARSPRTGASASTRRSRERARPRAAGRPPLVDVRRVLAADARPGAAGWPRCGCCTRSTGRRQVVCHFNKATKGRIVRALLEDGTAPAHAGAVRRPPRRARLEGRGRCDRPRTARPARRRRRRALERRGTARRSGGR